MAQFASIVKWTDAQIPFTLVANEQQRIGLGADNEQTLFKARVEVGEVGQVGKMLAVTVDDKMAEASTIHSGTGSFQASFIFAQVGRWWRHGFAKFRPINFDKSVFSGHGSPR
jgi:hypothetical protein